MKTYLLTSSKFTGAVVFEFDDNGYLVRYDITDANLNADQKVFMLNKLPRHIVQIKSVLGNSHTSKLTQQKAVSVIFEQFWNRYDEKTRSSKKKALQKWNRMSQINKDRAYNYIAVYERNIPFGIAKKYAETYLNAELWNN